MVKLIAACYHCERSSERTRIKKSVALLLCEKVHQEKSGRWYTFSGLTCRLCMKSPNGNLNKLRKVKGFRGCGLVNDWYDKLNGAKGKERLRKIR